jgi:dienelactone hydrolase
MSLILVSDVFGITPALLTLKYELGASLIIDPYQGKSMGFHNEAEAYSYFITSVGLDSYVTEVLKVLASVDCKTTLIGFSVGASAIWKLSESDEKNIIKGAVCFYGAQIRNFTQITPCFNINLVFPKNEPHFDVVELMAKLKNKQNVKTTQVDYLHGFMNYNSTNFDRVGYKDSVILLQSTLV